MPQAKQKKLSRFSGDRFYTYFELLAGVNFILLGASVFSYGEKFKFWDYALSDLGATKTLTGLENNSFYFFDLAMILSGAIMFFLARAIKKTSLINKHIYQYLTTICSLGFFISVFPDNISDPIHIVGTLPMFITLWFIAAMLLADLKSFLGEYKFFGSLMFLHIPIFAYGITFLLGMPIREFFQKFAFVALFTVLILGSRYICQYKIAESEERELREAV